MRTVEAALESGRIRLRPIHPPSVATIMEAAPIAFGLAARSISRRPLGDAIVGGVLFSTMLTLFVVPAVYVIFDARPTVPWPDEGGASSARRRGGGVIMV